MINRTRKSMAEKEQGFTLIELLVVIIIIGILSAIAIPIFLNQRKKAVEASMKADLHNAATVMETAITDNPTGIGFPGSFTDPLSTGNQSERYLRDNDLIVTKGNTIAWRGETGVGYCFRISSPDSDVDGSAPDKFLYYDSTQGGVQKKGWTPTGVCA